MRSIAFPGRFSSLDDIRDFFTEAAKEADLDKKSIYHVQLAVDEAASNIIEHAYKGEGKGEIECSYLANPGRLEIYLHDHGHPFDPQSIEAPDLNAGLYMRKQSGLGMHFMKSLMDSIEFSFKRESGNYLKMVKTRKDRIAPHNRGRR